jgi:hypothetical protein
VPYKPRVETLRILISGHPALTASARLNDITNELRLIATSSRFPRRSGWLLAVLHTTRALDTTLSEVLAFRSWRSRSPTLGSYLVELRNRSVITTTERIHYQAAVVDRRNTYMHQAGTIPTRIEADSILAEMHACVAVVLNQI